MCCDDDKKMDRDTQMQGAPGRPVGFEVEPADFMNPGAGFGEEDVMGAIFQQMGLPEEEEAYA